MPSPYVPKVWIDGSAGGTPITAADLTHIELGVRDAGTAAGVFDANASPYNLVVGSPGTDACPGLNLLVADMRAYAIANQGIAVAEFNPGEYYLNGALLTTYGCYAQVIFQPVANTQPEVAYTFRSKTLLTQAPYNIYNKTQKNLVFHSSFVGGVYDVTNGTPSMFGGPDKIRSPAVSLMHVTWQAVCFRQPANPSLTAVNDYNFNAGSHFVGCSGDTEESIIPGGLLTNVPTHPTGQFNVGPYGGNGYNYTGTTDISGYYTGPAIEELMTNSGMIISRECKIGLNYKGDWTHRADVGQVNVVACNYGIAYNDPAVGVSNAPNPGTAGRYGSFVTGMLDFEHSPAPWNNVADIWDPTNTMNGSFVYICGGPVGTNDQIVLNGAANIDLRDLNNKTTRVRKHIVSGDKIINAASFTAIDVTWDIDIDASAGDWVEVHISRGMDAGASGCPMDVGSIVAGAPVNSWAENGAWKPAGGGHIGWYGPNGTAQFGGATCTRQVTASDLNTTTATNRTTIKLRIFAYCAVNKTLYADAFTSFDWQVINLGRAGHY